MASGESETSPRLCCDTLGFAAEVGRIGPDSFTLRWDEAFTAICREMERWRDGEIERQLDAIVNMASAGWNRNIDGLVVF